MADIKEFKIQDINNAGAEITALINEEYDIGTVKGVDAIAIGDTNRNFKITVEKDGTEKKYFAKLFNKYKTLEKLVYEQELYDYFASRAKGRLVCPKSVPAKSGESVFFGICEEAEVSAYFVVFEFLPGESLDEGLWRHIMVDRYLEAFSKGLAAFHDFSYGFAPSSDDVKNTSFIEDTYTWEKAVKSLDILKNNPRTSDYFEFFKPHQQETLDYIKDNRAIIEEHLDELPVCITHGDDSPNNYMYEGDEDIHAVAVCDFDWAKERPRIYDICWMMCETVSEFDPETFVTTFDVERVKKFIKDYNERIEASDESGIGPITRKELEIVPEMMQLVMISMAINDRIGYMLENNMKLGTSEANIEVTYWGLSIADGVRAQKEEIRQTLLEM